MGVSWGGSSVWECPGEVPLCGSVLGRFLCVGVSWGSSSVWGGLRRFLCVVESWLGSSVWGSPVDSVWECHGVVLCGEA